MRDSIETRIGCKHDLPILYCYNRIPQTGSFITNLSSLSHNFIIAGKSKIKALVADMGISAAPLSDRKAKRGRKGASIVAQQPKPPPVIPVFYI